MKVLYCLTDSSPAGGMERSACSRLNYLSDVMGYEIILVTTDRGEKKNFFDFSDKIHFIDLNINYSELKKYSLFESLYHQSKKRKLHKQRLTEVINRLNPDICISTFTYELTILAKIKTKSAKIAEFHFSKPYKKIESELMNDSFFSRKRRLFGERNKYRYIKDYDAFVVLTEEDALRWKEFDNVKVIPNILPFYPSRYSDCMNKEVISVGRLIHQKGFEYLIDAWKLVNDKYPDWRLSIYGDGELLPILREKIRVQSLNDSITIYPSSENIAEAYLEASVYVMTSIYEGFGLSLVEAMSCGLPSVVFDCPSGPAEIVKDGIDGFVIDMKDMSSLAEKINILLGNSELRVEMGANARENAKHFLPENVMPKWIDLFSSM